MAGSGCLVTARAAAAGPTIRLNMSSAPTTGTAVVVARATSARNSGSSHAVRLPRASARPGEVPASTSGR